jgi:hypothetical protein
MPLVILAVQLMVSVGQRRRAGPVTHGAPLTWFGYLLLVAGPVVLLLRTLYPYAVLLTVVAITVVICQPDSPFARYSCRSSWPS